MLHPLYVSKALEFLYVLQQVWRNVWFEGDSKELNRIDQYCGNITCAVGQHILHDIRHWMSLLLECQWGVSIEKETWLLMFYQNV